MADKAKPALARGSIVGDNMPADVRAQWKAAERLQAVAERTIEDAQKIHDQPRLMNTARRARLGSGVMEQQQARIAHARTAMRIAEALREGTAGPELAKIQSLADVERLQSAYRQAMYANEQRRKANPGSMTGVEPTKLDIAHAKPQAFVRAHIFQSDAETLQRALKGQKGLARDLKIVAAIPNKPDNWRHTDPRTIQAIENVAQAVKKNVPKSGQPEWAKYRWEAGRLHSTANQWLGEVREFRAQQRLGLADATSMRRLLDAYSDVRVNRNGADPVKVAERALIGTKIPGFFPTPESLAKRMADLAEVQPGHHVLEPSAGTGRLADVAKAKGAKVDAVEVNSSLRDVLAKKGHAVVATDFTSMQASAKYDRILMNPPFEKGQDMAHVRRAYDMLKPGGKMVAIMGEGAFFRSDKAASGFRAWLDTVGGASEKLPPGTFKESNTGVNTRLVTIEKPLQVAPVLRNAAPSVVTSAELGANKQFASVEFRVGERTGSFTFHRDTPFGNYGTVERNASTNVRETYRAALADAIDQAAKEGRSITVDGKTTKLGEHHVGGIDRTRETMKGGRRQWKAVAYSPDKVSIFGEVVSLESKRAAEIAKAVGLPAYRDVVAEVAKSAKAFEAPFAALPQTKPTAPIPHTTPLPAAVAPTRGSRPLSASVSAAVERAMQMQAEKMAKPQATTLATKPITPSGKLGIALAVASNAVAIAGIVMSARKAEAAPAQTSSSTTFERTYRSGPKSGTTETVRKPAA